MNLIEVFQPSLRGRKDKAALHTGERTLTFGQLDALSDRLALTLRTEFKLQKGDRAAMFVENCGELVVYYLACLKLGAIVVPFNVLYKDHELSYLLQDAAPKLVLTDTERFAVLKPLLEKSPFIEKVFIADAPPSDARALAPYLVDMTAIDFKMECVSGDDPALLIYTSGTTGRSKGAVLTHNNLASNIIALLHCWQWTDQDRFVLALPMFHAHGLCNGVHGTIASGCTTFILKRFKADVVLDLLKQQSCTLFFGVPTMYERLLEAAATGRALPTTMRLYVAGSAALSPETFTKFDRVFGMKILERYGMSETIMLTSNLYAGPRKQGSVGTPLPGVSLRIVCDGRPVEQGEVGEIQVRGPTVFREYWRAPEKTAESFQDGWFKTGDLGSIDADGFVAISGRGKELIISGGFNIYPQEVIQCVCRHDEILEAAVIGVTDKLRGELVKAYVVRKNSASTVTADALIEFCKQHLASFKVPRTIVFLDALPRNAMGKLQLQLLPDRDKI